MSGEVCVIRAAALRGMEAVPVSVEVAVSAGLPGFTLVGLADSAVQESKFRVRCPLKAQGFEVPRLHFTINLAPAETRKSGSGFDLPIAVAILTATRQIPCEGLQRCIFVGEIGLDGSICPVRGGVAYAKLAKNMGLELVCAVDDSMAATGLSTTRTTHSLSELRQGVLTLSEGGVSHHCLEPDIDLQDNELDFADVHGQEVAKRAMVVAAAGRLGMLMIGPPGSGKTMLAKRLPTILPPLSEEERLEAMLITSVAGLSTKMIEAGRRPFRAPHHSISQAGLVGGGRPVVPGEISLAHKGVLFLDELPEFASTALQSLRQPMEDGEVRIVRVDGVYTFPCEFQLVAAANPCPCGYLGDPKHPCSCSPSRIITYQNRIGGPLLDRIDVSIPVARPSSVSVVRSQVGLSSKQMREQVMAGRQFASWRASRRGSERRNDLNDAQLNEEASQTLERMGERLGMGGRALARTVRVARTIADLEESEQVRRQDILEANAYRSNGGIS